MNIFQSILQRVLFPKTNTNIIVDEISEIPTSKELRYRTLQNIFSVLVSSIEIDKMAQNAVDVMSQQMGYIGGVIFIFDKEKKALVPWSFTDAPLINYVATFLKKPFREHFFPVTLKESLVVKTYLNKELYQSNNPSDFLYPIVDSPFLNNMVKVLGIKSYITLPIIFHNEILGVLWLTSNRVKAQNEEIEMLKTFSEQVGIALYNSILYEQTRNQVNQLAAKNREL